MAIFVTGDRYLDKLVKFVEEHAGPLIDGTLVLKLNPAGLHYVQSRLEALHELENLLSGAPIDYLRAYVCDLGDHRALEQLRRILRLLTSLKVVSVLPPPARDPTPLSLLPFGRLRILELRGCDLSTSAARGLVELRHTLEKIICHNSTDALRHVFASRIAEIRESPQWNRLSFVSCAFNRLVLMDESLQLLPAVETLDLSRNNFAKVDNLRKCTKLKHLDLGFNHLRSVAPFSEVSSHIVQLVLRNNALTTLRGLENLKSLEGLDVSYNIISNISELEFLASLPSLVNLWLEGNPLCCARWYRAQVFSYFAHPETLRLDDKEISTREFWKMQIIIASRQKRPASFGFYSPAKEDAGGEGSIIRKRRKVSRLASIESEEESTYFSSDLESRSCDIDIQSKEENAISDDEAEIVDLINRVELMKREDSILWLREFKEWLDHESENILDGGACSRVSLHHMKENHLQNKSNFKHQGESSRYALNYLHASGDETITDVNESNPSLAALSLSGVGEPTHKYDKFYLHDGLTLRRDNKVVENGILSPLTTIDDTTESYSSSAYPGSPPHYQVDILHRRHNLVEEILQLSAETYSVASSDSDTSRSDDDSYEYGHFSHTDQLQSEEYSNLKGQVLASCDSLKEKNYDQEYGILHAVENERFLFDSHEGRPFSKAKNEGLSQSQETEDKKGAGVLEKTKKSNRKPKKRVISLSGNGVDQERTSGRPNVDIDSCDGGEGDKQGKQTVEIKQLSKHAIANVGRFSDDFIEKYFNANVADSKINETCTHCMRCDCVLEPDSMYREREVALLLSSANKLYVLLIGVAFDGSGNILSLLGWHRVEDVKEVLVGIGLQVVRVYIDREATYLFLTRSIEKSQQLLNVLQVFGSHVMNDRCILKSLEQVQVELFDKQICGGSKMSILQYAMVLFWYKDKDESWVPRSLFVCGAHVFLCIEELKQFSSSTSVDKCSPYFSLDSCCSISDISEMVIESGACHCVTIVLEKATQKFRSKACKEITKSSKLTKTSKEDAASGSLKWYLKWFSEEGLLNFVALLKAIHSGSSLLIRQVS